MADVYALDSNIYINALRDPRQLAILKRFLVRRAAYAPALTNDAAIAASCREADVVLVTENTSDFTAIKRHLRGFRFVDSTALSS